MSIEAISRMKRWRALAWICLLGFAWSSIWAFRVGRELDAVDGRLERLEMRVDVWTDLVDDVAESLEELCSDGD